MKSPVRFRAPFRIAGCQHFVISRCRRRCLDLITITRGTLMREGAILGHWIAFGLAGCILPENFRLDVRPCNPWTTTASRSRAEALGIKKCVFLMAFLLSRILEHILFGVGYSM